MVVPGMKAIHAGLSSALFIRRALRALNAYPLRGHLACVCLFLADESSDRRVVSNEVLLWHSA